MGLLTIFELILAFDKPVGNALTTYKNVVALDIYLNFVITRVKRLM